MSAIEVTPYDSEVALRGTFGTFSILSDVSRLTYTAVEEEAKNIFVTFRLTLRNEVFYDTVFQLTFTPLA